MTSATTRVLVTGGTGFLGAAVCAELAESGYAVHVLARRVPSGRGPIPFAGASTAVQWHTGDLSDPDSLARAAETASPAALVHNAAVISYATRDRALQEEVNVRGTERVLAAAERAGLGPVVHVSSVVAVGHARGDEVLDEESPFNGAELRVDYVDTKRSAEEAALASSLDLRVVNPGAVFGPTDREANIVRFLRQLARGKAGPFAPPGALSVVGVRDVARGIRLALERGRSGRRYLLVERPLSALELYRAAARELGVRPARGNFPRPVWRALATGVAGVDRVRALELASPQVMRMLGASFRASGERARGELGWEPAPFDEVLRECIAYLRERRAL